MGACASASNPEDQAITQELENDRRTAARCRFQILVVGLPGSGKGTLFKQMEMLHGAGFSNKQRRSFIPVIRKHIIMRAKALSSSIHRSQLSDESQKALHYLSGIDEKQATLTPAVSEYIKQLCSEGVIPNDHDDGHFINDVDRIQHNDYTPTEQDILLTPTTNHTSVMEQKLTVMDQNFHMIYYPCSDAVEWRKILHQFDRVTTVIFVCDLSSYDIMHMDTYKREILLYGYIAMYFDDADNIPYDLIVLMATFCHIDDEDCNQMQRSLNLFENICYHHRKYTRESNIVLFLNKRDKFEQKLAVNPISNYEQWSDFDEDLSVKRDAVDRGVEYFRDLFKDRASQHDEHEELYAHITCMTDRDFVHKVFNDVAHLTILSTLKAS